MSTQAEIENHAEVSERFLRHAIAEFENHDLPQASEKAWGAVAHYLKSVAKIRGWRNHSHRDLIDIAHDLARETDDHHRVDELFSIVSNLHINFYEDHLLDSTVSMGIDAAHELISRLDARIEQEIHPRPSQIARQRRR